MSTRVKLENARIQFSKLDHPEVYMENGVAKGAPVRSAEFLIAKDSPQAKMVKDALVAAAKDKWKDKAPEIFKSLWAERRTALHDGDRLRETTNTPMAEGCFILKAKSKGPVKCAKRSGEPNIDKDGNTLWLPSTLIYDGCYVNVWVDVYGFFNPRQPTWGKRICCDLKGVQFVRDGDAFVGSPPIGDDSFSDLSDQGEEATTESDDMVF